MQTLSAREPVQVRLRVEAHLENPLVQRELVQLFAKYKGEDIVYLHLMGSHKVIKTTPNFWVNSEAPGFAEDVVKILGRDCIYKM